MKFIFIFIFIMIQSFLLSFTSPLAFAIDNPDAPNQSESFAKEFSLKWSNFQTAKDTKEMEKSLKDILQWCEEELKKTKTNIENILGKNTNKKLLNNFQETEKAWSNYQIKTNLLLFSYKKNNPSSATDSNIYQMKIDLIKEHLDYLFKFLKII